MIDFFVKQWNKNHKKLREYFENNTINKYNNYKDLVKLVLELVINKDNYVYGETINIKKLKEIDYGNYQGCLIYVFPANTYQPLANDTFYTTVDYGSCSVCDTLLGIFGYTTDERLTKKQVDELMQLCLNLVQNTHRFKDEEQIDSLEQQLAEKEKEIERIKTNYVGGMQNANEATRIFKEQYCKANQDKISFCIEQLEKVKEFCEKELKECDKLLKTEFEDDFYIQSVMARESMCFDFRRTIDNQIAELRKEQDGK